MRKNQKVNSKNCNPLFQGRTYQCGRSIFKEVPQQNGHRQLVSSKTPDSTKTICYSYTTADFHMRCCGMT
ncbi:hypothetical protein GDO78_009925 [Eleutherodactylus coqui]|uniref:Uncharacterized protein n=1 Tax=Eleutherodactylus coqui TaxID=57060 RepID=A0A8J6FAX8_ELECQ|nr:hypothetical protein GDO78_009925 [Eleutherodactylus coqui]